MPRPLTALVAHAALATPAISGNLIDATDPAVIVDLARGYGSARLETDALGDPMIAGRIDGTGCMALFYGCTDGADCRAIQVLAIWDNPGGVTLEKINQWNRTWNYGRASLDAQDDLILDDIVNLDGGVTIRNLDDSLDWWRFIIAQFTDEMVEAR